MRAAAERFVALWGSLGRSTATASAPEAITRIVQETGVVHADLLDGRARAARVSAVVGLMRFARERVGRLEQPRDLRSFVSYLGDLDERDRSFRVGRLTHEDDEAEGGSGGDGGADADAVRLLTAHSAKGLEFDTVYLPRVETRHGYPSVRPDDPEDSIPRWLADGEEHADGTPAERGLAALQDEERRLFYVACTRAKRRLVVLGKVPKKRPSGTNYFYELLDEPGQIVERDAAELLGPYARDGVDHEAGGGDGGGPDWASMDARRSRARSEARRARLDAAAALESAGSAGSDRERFDGAATRLRQAAERLAVVESALRGDDAPAWVERADLRVLHGELTASGDGPANTPAEKVLEAMRSPLNLSYTMLDQWERCPRCFATRFVLGLTEAETAKTVVGKAVHKALEDFYRRFRDAGEDETVGEPGLDDLLAMGESAFDAEWSASEVIDAAQRERVRALLAQGYAALHDASLNPLGFEQAIRFQYTPGGDAAGSGPHWFTAKIDRIDESPEGYRVVDYKTGKASKALTEVDKKDLQFGIYAMAMRAYAAGGLSERTAGSAIIGGSIETEEVPAGFAEYWVLATGERGRVSFDDLAGYEPKLRAKIDTAIAGMLSGTYPKGSGCQGFCRVLDPSELLGDA